MDSTLPARRPSLWAHNDFRRLWAAQSLSAFGNRITRTAIPVIAINSLGAGAQAVAWLSAAGFLPLVLAGLFASGFVERARKRRLMVAMDLARFAVVIAIPIAAAFGGIGLALLFGVSLLAGLASALFQNADTSVLPQLIAKDDLIEGNAKLQTTESLAEILGPGIAGVLIDLLTAPIAIIVDAATFLWSALWLLRITAPGVIAGPGQAVSQHASPWHELKADLAVGWRAVMRPPALRATFLAVGIYYVAGGGFLSLYMLLALRSLHLSPSTVGVVIGFGGLGALVGTALAPRLERWLGLGPAIFAGLVLADIGLFFLFLASAGVKPAVPLLAAQQLVGDGGSMVFMILATSLRQQAVKGDELARANGLFQIAMGTVLPVFGILAGVLADLIGIRTTLMFGIGIGALCVLPCLSPALLSVRSEPAAPIQP